MSRLFSRPTARRVANGLGSVRWDVLETLLRMRAGNTGELIHNNPPRYAWNTGCPFCGCRSWFSFVTGDEDTQGMDVFECLRCMATSTRLDHCGVDEWKKMMERDRARKASGE